MARYETMQPTKAETVDELPVGPNWIYEQKFDGYRTLGRVAMDLDNPEKPPSVILTSRNRKDLTHKFPKVVTHLPASLPGHSAVVDGEVISVMASGQQSLRALQRKHTSKAYMIFDLLELDGNPLIKLPLRDRRGILKENFVEQPNIIHLSEAFDDPDAILQAVGELALEGVVAKNLDSRYQSGKRSKDWVKYKFPEYEPDWHGPRR